MSLRIKKPSLAYRGPARTPEDATETPGRSAVPPPSPGDTYLSRLAKMIPGEAITLYGAGSGLIPKVAPMTGGLAPAQALLGWSIVCAIAVVLLRYKSTQDAAGKPQWAAIWIALISFSIWLYAIGGPFEAFSIKPSGDYLGSLVILAWTFFVPLLYRGD